MQFQKEATQNHSILSYTQNSISLNFASYFTNVLITANTIIFPWIIESKLSEKNIEPIFLHKPEIFIVGTNNSQAVDNNIKYLLYKQNIGLEIMNIGAACRTFNLLLNESRNIMLGIIFT